MRRDVHVPNETDGFVFTSAALRALGLSSGSAEWSRALAGGQVLPVLVESEDAANVRVVVDDALTAAEEAQWVGRVQSGLRVPDGRLVVCGGIAYLLEKAAWAEEEARVVEIPPGDYQATVYCYASAPNGRLCVERSGAEEPFGSWFRRTRPGEELPPWLHNLCIHDPDVDPGRRAQWKREKWKRDPGVVDFLVHLERATGALVVGPVNGDGFMEAGECRKPEPFPLGVPVQDLPEVDVEPPEAELVPPVASPAPVVEARTIDGGPVAVPVIKLARLARLAWMCHPYARPTLRLTFADQVPRLEPVEDADIRAERGVLEVAFEDGGQPAGALTAMTAVARQLGSIPDGTVIELETARRSSRDALGRHRYRGAVSGGTWQVTESFPPLTAECLREALTLAEALENGRRLSARDDAEAARIEARVAAPLKDMWGSNALKRTGSELALTRRDPTLFAHVVSRVFWMRYADSWPVQDEDAAR